jgi:hypothetical protein
MKNLNGISKKMAAFAVAGSLLLSLTGFATAESESARTIRMSAGNVPTNLANVHTYPDAPIGFNPVTASDDDLATYGFPPRPDKQAEPDHYALWERAMQAAKIRWHGELKPLIKGQAALMPASQPASMESAGNATPTGPSKWSNVAASGVNLTNTQKTWSNTYSFNDIYTVISVPTAQIPFGSGSCYNSGSSDLITYSFAGIGGYIFYSSATGYPLWQDAEEGGVITDINCAYGTSYTAYFSWGSAINGTGAFSVNPGDLFYTEVHANGATSGWVYLEDLTTLTYNNYTVGGFTISGNSAQFMVARPCCFNSGNLDGMYPLPNTIGTFFDGGAALVGSGKAYYPGSQATTTQILTMTNDQYNQNIELVNQGNASGYEGMHALWFQTTGCAYTPGCTP